MTPLDVQWTILSLLSATRRKNPLVYKGLKNPLSQGSHRLEKYLNLEGFLEKPLKIKSAFKRDRDLNHYKIVVPIFGAAYAAPNKGITLLY